MGVLGGACRSKLPALFRMCLVKGEKEEAQLKGSQEGHLVPDPQPRPCSLQLPQKNKPLFSIATSSSSAQPRQHPHAQLRLLFAAGCGQPGAQEVTVWGSGPELRHVTLSDDSDELPRKHRRLDFSGSGGSSAPIPRSILSSEKKLRVDRDAGWGRRYMRSGETQAETGR